jgi:hypothetical protein
MQKHFLLTFLSVFALTLACGATAVGIALLYPALNSVQERSWRTGDAHSPKIFFCVDRVLRARLADACFFWNQDRKIRLEDRVEALKGC